MNPLKRPPRPPVPQERPPRPPVRLGRPQNPPSAFVAIWLAIFLVCGALHALVGFATALGAGDTSTTESPIYVVYLAGAMGAFVSTQAGVYVIGARLLEWGRPVRQVVALALLLYGISLWGLCWIAFLPWEVFTLGQ